MAARFVVLSGILLSGACSDLSENPCEDYVNYVCECHADNPDLDCATLRAVHTNADVEVYEDCRLEHEALMQADSSLGEGCLDGDYEEDTAP